MKWEIKDVIAEEIAKAKEYKAQANSGWSFFPHKKLSYLECERNRYYAERHNQIAAWLRELAERRKAPEIIRCGECKYLRRWTNVNHQFCNITACKVSEDEFCNRVERKTDND